MTRQSTLALAKQGDLRAIASVVDYILKDKDIKVRAYIKDNCLFLTLESSIPLEQVSTIHTIHKLLNNLAIPKLITAKVQGKLEGISKAHWIETIDLATPVKSQLKKGAIVSQASTSPATQKPLPEQPKNQSNNPPETAPRNKQSPHNVLLKKSRWSPWFPYPSSWLRTLGLIIWLSIIVCITMYWARLVGIIMSIILANPEPLFKALAGGLLISGFIFTYLHHILFGRETSNFKYWLPSSKSWWEGLYALIVMTVSFLVVAIIIIPFIPKTYCALDELKYWQSCLSNLQRFNYFWNSNYFLRSNYFWRYNYSFIEILAIIGAILWLFTTAYLYQIEFLIRKNFSAQKLIESLREVIKPLRTIIKFLLIAITSLSLVFLVSFTVKNAQSLQNLLQSYVPRSSPTPIISNAATNLTNPSSSPTPITSISPTASPVPADPFALATENALQASKLVQVAKTKAEWQKVAEHWEAAITFMQVVPGYHPKYAIAQQKSKEYQSNLEYAKLAGSKAIS